jgi:hypothetical protein
LSAMAHGEFLLLARLAERAPHLRTEKQGIVPEAALAPRLAENGPFHRAPPHAAQSPALSQRDGAHKACAAILHAAEFFEQQSIIRLVDRQRRTGYWRMQQRESRRKHTRRAIERVHFQAGIVREEQAGGVAAVVQRLRIC